MDIKKLIEERHSVRKFTDKAIPSDIRKLIDEKIAEINNKSNLSLLMVYDEEQVFKANKPHYGFFEACKNYLIIAGCDGLDEEAGYFGEEALLYLSSLGINSCWVALTYEKKAIEKEEIADKKIYCLLALGYGKTNGKPHRSKSLARLSKIEGIAPDWFNEGLYSASLAPTAINQQRFRIEYLDGLVNIVDLKGPYSKVDLGIVKYHFEALASRNNFFYLDEAKYIKDCLLKDIEAHPKANATDIIKFAYQATFGAEHLLKSIDAAKKYFDEEWESIPASQGALFQEISPNFVRLNLSAAKFQGLDKDLIFSHFASSASKPAGSPLKLVSLLKYLDKELGFKYNQDITNYLNGEIGPVHHSSTYHEGAIISYRLMDKENLKELDK